MYLIMMFGVFVCRSLLVSVCRFTVSKALVMSRAIASVLCGGLLLLNPVAIVLLMVWSAVVVEWFVRNPC